MNTSTDLQWLKYTPATNSVSWYCAFWTLVPLALNSMTQPSGKVLGLPAIYGFALRSSPLICCCDALATMALLVYRTIILRSPRAAVHKVIQERFRKDEDSPDQRRSFHELQQNVTFRILVFAFGALPQAIKLFALQNIFWTKVWGAMFLVSFILMEIMVVALSRNANAAASTAQVHTSPDPVLPLGFLVLCGSISFAFYHLILGALKATENNWGAHPELGLMAYTLVVAIATFAVLAIARKRHLIRQQPSLLAAGLSFSMFAGFRAIVSYQPYPYRRSIFTVPEASLFASMFYLMAIAFSVQFALFASIQIYLELNTLYNYKTRYVNVSIGMYFVWLNLASATLFYGYKYDETGTTKPPWTEYLG